MIGNATLTAILAEANVGNLEVGMLVPDGSINPMESSRSEEKGRMLLYDRDDLMSESTWRM
jgi:hypothetical protein